MSDKIHPAIEAVARDLAKLIYRSDRDWELQIGAAKIIARHFLDATREPSTGMIDASLEKPHINKWISMHDRLRKETLGE